MNTPRVLQAEIGALGRHGDGAWAGPDLRRAGRRRGAGVAGVGRAVPDGTGLRARRRHGCAHALGRRLLARTAGLIPGLPPMHGPNEGASGTWVPVGRSASPIPTDRVAVGFVRNHLENQALPLMGACLVDVLYSCLGQRGRWCTQLTRQHRTRTAPRSIFEPSGRVVTWSEYEQTANQVAHLLRQSGLRKGDHIALFMENIPEVLLDRGGGGADGRVLHPGQLVPLGGRGRVHRQRLEVAGRRSRRRPKQRSRRNCPRCAPTSSAGS